MNYVNLIIGNLCSLLAMATDSISSTRKTAKEMLLIQNLSQLVYCTSGIVLKGYSAAVQNVVSMLRNFLAIKKVNSKVAEWILVLLGVVLGVWFNNLGLMGYLPVIANLQYTLVMFRFRENERALKISFLVNAALFAVFNIVIYNVVGVVTNLVVFVTTGLCLIRPKKA